MFIESDVFLIDGKEYKLRLINKHDICWLEPVLKRFNGTIITGGLNRVIYYDDLEKYEYIEWRY